MNITELEKRILRIEDIEAIKQLKARYCYICDDNHNPDHITEIFTEDGVWEGRGIGKAEGSAAIKALFLRFQEAISFSQHMVQNPIIEVNGDQAHATWYFFGTFTFYINNQAKWQSARYHEDYVKVKGEWKIKHLKIGGPTMIADYETGWAKPV